VVSGLAWVSFPRIPYIIRFLHVLVKLLYQSTN
jgi:hypothetical protein